MNLRDAITLGKRLFQREPRMSALVNRIEEVLRAGRVWSGNQFDWTAAYDTDNSTLTFAFRPRNSQAAYTAKLVLNPEAPVSIDITPFGPTAGGVEQTNRIGRLVDGAETELTGIAVVPETLPVPRGDGTFSYWYFPRAAASGNVEFISEVSVSREGGQPITPSAQIRVETIASASRVITRVDQPITGLAGAGLIGVTVLRDAQAGNDPPDTYAGDVGIMGWRVRYLADLRI